MGGSMIATIQFELPAEQESFDDATDGWKWRAAMCEVMAELRQRVKYEELPEAEKATIEAVRDMIYEVLDEHKLEADV